ncbi:Sulfate/thiosulfate import ATP-binding protein CysA [Lentibacillus sp. JNUCC-1]|uniref:ABC transporter ATP-binding protein n=1 Tax=Lentibacillus sp. JNUCC-1 TaxID=2654513 RepID=UPI0012E80946|nr:ABC transporter ATP-binding protein [Lentibacillus sp. JNUCC-1]MUV37765.1 Sulfate/thiosulfate import ATP-binding protein CysA [Lentibacillus sp. JNUCC-1]
MTPHVLLKNVQKSFKNETVLEDISLSIPEGQLFGLLGPSGSGKTTLVKVMIGLLEPTSGMVMIAGKKIPSLKVMKDIGYMAQADALYTDLTARQNLAFFAGVYGIPGKKRKARIREVAQIVDLESNLDKRLEQFSGGMLRRMSLAVALLNDPKLLILDEPTVGIDPVLRASIWKDLKALQEKGTTIIITTHVMDEAEKCDNLALLRDGYAIAQGSPSELKQKSHQSTLEEAFLHFGQGNWTPTGKS